MKDVWKAYSKGATSADLCHNKWLVWLAGSSPGGHQLKCTEAVLLLFVSPSGFDDWPRRLEDPTRQAPPRKRKGTFSPWCEGS